MVRRSEAHRVQLELTGCSWSSRTSAFARVLSNFWLTSNLMDLMTGQLADRLAEDNRDHRTVIEFLSLQDYLESDEVREKILQQITSR